MFVCVGFDLSVVVLFFFIMVEEYCMVFCLFVRLFIYFLIEICIVDVRNCVGDYFRCYLFINK